LRNLPATDLVTPQENKTIGLLRADTGFYSKRYLNYLESDDKPCSTSLVAQCM